MDPVSKIVLYNKISQFGMNVFTSTGVPLDVAMTIIAEGLDAMVSIHHIFYAEKY